MILILPFFIYFIFVYSAKENFFVKLKYVGPRTYATQMVDGVEVGDTAYYRVPAFNFLTQHDTTLSREDLQGKIVLVNFFFSTCPSICPAMNYNVQQIQERFKGYPDFRIVSFSVDPEHDTVEVLQKYAEKMGAREGLWYFLTGDQDSIYATAEGFFSSAMPDSAAEGGFLHSENLILLDWNGHIRSGKDDDGNIMGVYNGLQPNQINTLKEDIKVLIAEYEKHKAAEEYRLEKLKEGDEGK